MLTSCGVRFSKVGLTVFPFLNVDVYKRQVHLQPGQLKSAGLADFVFARIQAYCMCKTIFFTRKEQKNEKS